MINAWKKHPASKIKRRKCNVNSTTGIVYIHLTAGNTREINSQTQYYEDSMSAGPAPTDNCPPGKKYLEKMEGVKPALPSH